MNDNSSETRLADLEVQIAHQNETIETLNEAIISQWKEIDKLSIQVRVLTEQISSMEDDLLPHKVTKPPHY